MYFDVSLPAEEESEYNHIYRTYWGKDVDLDFIMGQEAYRVINDLMQYRHDPHMFHQVMSLHTVTIIDVIF